MSGFSTAPARHYSAWGRCGVGGPFISTADQIFEGWGVARVREDTRPIISKDPLFNLPPSEPFARATLESRFCCGTCIFLTAFP